MKQGSVEIRKWLRIGATIHSVALSAEGRYLLVGSEHDLRLFDLHGKEHLRWSKPGADIPVTVVALAPDASLALAGLRSGGLYRFDFDLAAEQKLRNYRDLWPEPNAVYSLSLSATGDRVLMGHFGPTLTLIDIEGDPCWRQAETKGQTWAVTFSADGNTLYAGSSGTDKPILAALDAGSGKTQVGVRTARRVTLVSALPPPLAVAAVLSDLGGCEVVAYPSDLRTVAWSYPCDSGEYVTAMTSDALANLLVLGTNTGRILLLQANEGQIVAQQDGMHSTVRALAISEGRYLLAGLQDDQADYQVAYMEYIPPVLEDEVIL